MTRQDVLKSYTKYPLYSHQNSLPPLIYIILINPTCTREQCVKKEEKVFEIRVCFIPALVPADKKYLRIPSKNVKFNYSPVSLLVLLDITHTYVKK